jgi:hypothetical protein
VPADAIDVALANCGSVLGVPAPVEQTGQTTPFAPGDDGSIRAGVPWPSPRFTDNGNATVRDNLTGLIWLQNANCFGPQTWVQALTDANALASGSCGLTDGSVPGDWRLPNAKELGSLIDFSTAQHPTALPAGHPFSGVQSSFYWSSTTYAGFLGSAYIVGLGDGSTIIILKEGGAPHVWPVRGPE